MNPSTTQVPPMAAALPTPVQFPSGKNVAKTYICESCGISTITLANERCNYCGSVTNVLPEGAVEIPIPKSEWGTDFIAVVHQGKVLDILLLSDRSSVYYAAHGLARHVQEYVDRLEPA